MSDDPNEYEFPFRTNFELRILLGWVVCGVILIILPTIIDVPFDTYRWFGIAFIIIGCVMGRNGIEIYHKKKKLKGYKIEVIDTASDYVLNDLFQVKDKELVKKIIENNKKGKKGL